MSVVSLRRWVDNIFSLSPTEVETLQHLANGASTKEICVKHNQTLRAFYVMMERTRGKMNALTTAEAVAIGIRRRIIS